MYVAFILTHIIMQWIQIRGEARLDRQVPEGSKETESTLRPLYTFLGLISGATTLRDLPLSLQAAEFKILFLKKQFSCLLASIKTLGDLHAFSVNESCLEFGPRPRPGHVPKVPTSPLKRDQVVSLQVLPWRRQTQLWLFSVPSAPCGYNRTECKASGPQTSFCLLRRPAEGKAVSKQSTV
ncbi:hypothetical protein PO909_022409 [Leuciscus waleckii]